VITNGCTVQMHDIRYFNRANTIYLAVTRRERQRVGELDDIIKRRLDERR
jgi:hypothetical protein